MKIIRIENDFGGIDWNGLVGSLPEGTVYQTTYWGQYIRKNQGIKLVSLIAQDDSGRISGSLLAYETPIFRRLLKYGRLGDILYKNINKKKFALTWIYGPLVYDKDRFDEVFNSLIDEIEIIAKERQIFLLKDFSLPIHGSNIYIERGNLILFSNGFRFKESATILIDLTKEVDYLWRNLKNSARKALKKILGYKIEIRLLNRNNLNAYQNLLYESRRRAKVEVPPTYPNEAMWEGIGGDSGRLRVFSVRMDSRLLAAIGIISFNGIIFETGPAQSDYSFNNKIYVNDILKWEVIKWGLKNNNRIYDLSGIPVKVKNEKDRRQRQFKEKWGGQIIRYQTYSKILL